MEEKLLKQILQELLNFENHTDKRFDEMKEYVDTRFDEMKKYVDGRFNEVNQKFNEMKEYVDTRFDKLTAEIVQEHRNMMEIAYNKSNRDVGNLQAKVQKGAEEFARAVAY